MDAFSIDRNSVSSTSLKIQALNADLCTFIGQILNNESMTLPKEHFEAHIDICRYCFSVRPEFFLSVDLRTLLL